MEQLLNMAQAAEILGVTERTVDKLVAEQQPHVQVGASIRSDKSASCWPMMNRVAIRIKGETLDALLADSDKRPLTSYIRVVLETHEESQPLKKKGRK